MRDLKKKGLYLSNLLILTLMVIITIPSSTSHSATVSPDISFFNCNGSSAECLGRSQDQDDDVFGFEFLMESETSQLVVETKRKLNQRGRPTHKALNPANAACARVHLSYKCTPPRNKNVIKSDNCKGSPSLNRNCHRQ